MQISYHSLKIVRSLHLNLGLVQLKMSARIFPAQMSTPPLRYVPLRSGGIFPMIYFAPVLRDRPQWSGGG